MKSGIYRIYSINTGESYYGSSKNMRRRFTEHKFRWRKGVCNYKMRKLLEKYGIDNFKFEVLEYCDASEFDLKEKEYIAKDTNRLNVWVLPFSSAGCSLGDNVKGKKYFGTPHTVETKEKQSRIMKEYWSTHIPFWKGKSLSEETRKKVSDGLKRHFSINTHPNVGKSPSAETRLKISETLKKRNSNVLSQTISSTRC